MSLGKKKKKKLLHALTRILQGMCVVRVEVNISAYRRAEFSVNQFESV